MSDSKELQYNNNKAQYGATLSANEEGVQTQRKLRYPKSVFFIISNEFCERFSYYGMRTILSLYLRKKLAYTETDATLIYHSFVMLCYFFPLFGAILADSFIGKYKTILYLSIVYALGSITLSATSTGFGFLGHSERGFTLLGLVLVALGTGGIKPCVSSFGGDQFVLPEQERQMQQFFSVFYFSINAGSLISTFLTPELRAGSCMGQDTCYPIAFGVPAILMIASLLIFVAGKRMYKMKKPSGNIIIDVVKCSSNAVVRKIKSSEKHDHWLDYAKPNYSQKLIDDTKIVMSIILLFSPTILFWALFEQQGTAWTFQATRMNGQLGDFTIKPDQMQVINPILILVFIPVFEFVIYPFLAKLHLIRTPLQKLTAGGLLVAVAFFIAAGVESKIQPTYEIIPKTGEAQLRIINGFNCTTNVAFEDDGLHTEKIDRLGILQLTALKANDKKSLQVSISINKTECSLIQSDFQKVYDVQLTENESVSFLFSNNISDPTNFYLTQLGEFDVIRKDEYGSPQLRVVYDLPQNSILDLTSGANVTKASFELPASGHTTKTLKVPYERFTVKLNGKAVASDVNIEFAGVYTMLIKQDGDQIDFNLYEISPPSTVHILWQLPQIIVLTAAEIMFSITGLEFCYSQAPTSMKSVMSSLWLLTDAFGNMCVLIMAELLQSDSRVRQFLTYGVSMIVIMIIFSLLALRYKYVKPQQDENETEDVSAECKENPAFNPDE